MREALRFVPKLRDQELFSWLRPWFDGEYSRTDRTTPTAAMSIGAKMAFI